MTYLAKTFRLSVLLETKGREVDARTEDLCLCKNANTTDTVNLHLHVWVTVRVAEIGQMRSPGGIFCIAFDNDGIFVKGVSKRERGLGFLPGVQIVRLLATKPVRKWAPNVCEAVSDTYASNARQPTWYNHILVVSHEILKNGEWGCLDIDISPVDPAVGRSQSCAQKPVTRLSHGLTTASLRSKTVTRLDILVDLLSEVLLHDRDLTKCLLGVWVGLQFLQLLGQQRNSVVLGVSYEERQIDEVVRVGQVLQMAEEHGQMRRRIS